MLQVLLGSALQVQLWNFWELPGHWFMAMLWVFHSGMPSFLPSLLNGIHAVLKVCFWLVNGCRLLCN